MMNLDQVISKTKEYINSETNATAKKTAETILAELDKMKADKSYLFPWWLQWSILESFPWNEYFKNSFSVYLNSNPDRFEKDPNA